MSQGSGFTAVPDALRSAGAAADEAVTAMAGADCWGPVRDVARALPGAGAGAAAGAYAGAWSTYSMAWTEQARAHGEGLAAAGRDYAATDAGSAGALRGVPAGDAPSASGSGRPAGNAGHRPGVIMQALGGG